MHKEDKVLHINKASEIMSLQEVRDSEFVQLGYILAEFSKRLHVQFSTFFLCLAKPTSHNAHKI